MDRRLMAKGEWYVIECAVRSDGTSPASEFFDALASGSWEPDPPASSLEPDEQVNSHDRLLDYCQALADTGDPYHTGAINYLTDGVWEFKRQIIRVSFFDTPGDGTYIAKGRRDGRTVRPWHQFYWFPELDYNIRLGHTFPKTGQQTEEFDLDEALAVRREDLAYDE